MIDQAGRFLLVWTVVFMLFLPVVSWGKSNSNGESLLQNAEKLAQDFKFAESEIKLKEAVKTFESAGDREGMARSVERLGKVYFDVGNYAGAIDAFQEAAKIYRDAKQPAAETRVMGAIGLAYDDWGDLPGALHYYKNALKSNLPPSERSRFGMNLGDVYLRLGDKEESARQLRTAMQIAQSAKPDKTTGETLLAIGEAFQKAGYSSEAKSAYEAISQITGAGDVNREAQYHLGDIAFTQKNVEEAAKYYRQAKYMIGLGRLALVEKKFDVALQNFDKALTEAANRKQPQMVFAAQTGIGLSFLGKTQYSQAETHLRQAVTALEGIRELLPEGKRTYFLSNSTHGFQHLATYDALIMTLVMQGKKDDAFKMAEYTRSRVLTETLSCKEAIAQETARPVPMSPLERGKGAGANVNDETAIPANSIEIMPLGKLALTLQTEGSHDHAALCALFVKAILEDFDGEQKAEANNKAINILQRSGFPDSGAENVKKKIEDLRQQGLRNHLTALLEATGKKTKEKAD